MTNLTPQKSSRNWAEKVCFRDFSLQKHTHLVTRNLETFVYIKANVFVIISHSNLVLTNLSYFPENARVYLYSRWASWCTNRKRLLGTLLLRTWNPT